MCCRYLLRRKDIEQAMERLSLPVPQGAVSRYNIAPGTVVLAVRRTAGAHGCLPAALTWGLVPSWTKPGRPATGLVNARAEGIEEKLSFRDAFRMRRCLLPAGGFYEWRAEGRHRQPWLFQLLDEKPFFLAGLWEPASAVAETETCAIITTDANSVMRPVHDRMPVIVPLENAAQWLDPAALPAGLAGLMQPFPAAEMTARPLDSRVNSTAYDDEACLAPPPASQLYWEL